MVEMLHTMLSSHKPVIQKIDYPLLIVYVHKIQPCRYMFSYVHQYLPTPLFSIFLITKILNSPLKTQQYYRPHVQIRYL